MRSRQTEPTHAATTLRSRRSLRALANRRHGANEPPSARLGSGVRRAGLALRLEGDAGLRVRTGRCGWPGWRADRYRSPVRRMAARRFSTPVAVTKEQSQPRLGARCASQDRRRSRGPHRAWRSRSSGTRHSTARCSTARSTDGGKEFCGAASRSRRATRASASRRSALDPDGSVFAAWLDKRNRVPAQQERPEIRRRRPVLRVVAGWRRDLFRSAHVEGQHLRMLPAGHRLCRPGPAGRRVQEHLRRRHPGSRGR